ncbi:MAG: LysR substrate-binding domain-containing protein [Rhodospirillales bacterium]|nr:LysR substrate-binding domain-containing protein [Rhodospirillales bacterium]
MKLAQLRYVLEIARHKNHLSEAASALNTSQPGVSRQIQLLEAELGFEIFRRTRNRIIGLTEPGQQVLAIATRVVTDVAALQSLKEEVKSGNHGTLTVGTTHTQARHVLPKVVKAFVSRYPNVQLVLKQGNPEDICALVEEGYADLAIGTDTAVAFPNLIQLPCFSLPRSVVAPIGHPILEKAELTLQDVAAYPIITYDPRYSGRWRVMNAFKKAGLNPTIILSAIDADVCKTYVELGLGIGILTTIAFDPAHDVGLGIRDAHHLFDPSTIIISLRSNSFLRKFILDFIGMVSPKLTPKVIRDAMESKASAR